MLQSVLAMDGATLATVVVKALAYLASLTAAGSALVLPSLTKLDRDTRRMVGRLGLGCAFTAGLASAALIPVGAIYHAGGLWAGAADETTYGRLLAVKLAVYLLLLGLAAFNRLRLAPALLAGDAGAGVRLRRSIGLEFAAVLIILATTAILTTIASPDMEG